MSYRPLYNKFMSNTMLRQLLMRQTPLVMRTQLQHSIKPRTPFNKPSLFSPTIIKRYWETIPLIVFTLCGFTCECLGALLLGLTRADVCYFGKMPYEDYTRILKNKPPPIRKLSPLFIIVGGAVLGLFYAIVRNGLSRDDVRFYSSDKMNCEDVEKSGPRKFLVFNQKYKVPEGLKEALAALEEPVGEETKKSK